MAQAGAITLPRRFSLLNSMSKIGGIGLNTFRESIRQPVFGIILAVAFGLIVLSPVYTLFTLMESPKLIKDMGLATILLSGLLLGAFSAGNVVSQEIENKTALTVLSKPVDRIEFVIGKYVGVALSLLLAAYVLSVTLILTMAAGAFEADLQVVHDWVVYGLIGASIVTVAVAIFANYYMDLAFAPTAVLLSVGFFTAVLFIFLVWTPPPEMVNVTVKVDPQVALGCFLVICALLMLGAVAVAASVRLSMALNIVLCVGVLLLGLLSDYLFGRHAYLHKVADVVSIRDADPVTVVKMASFVAGTLDHPTAAAIFRAGRDRGIDFPELEVVDEWRQWFESWQRFGEGPILLGDANRMAQAEVDVTPLARRYDWIIEGGRRPVYVAKGKRVVGVLGVIDQSNLLARGIYAIVPNLQVFWIADALVAERSVPYFYALRAGLYAVLYIAAMLFLAMFLFQEKELS